SACSQALTSLAGNPAAARHSVALISVVTALDTSQSADPVKAQPREHQTPLTPARGTPRRSRRGDPVAGVQRPQPQALDPRWSSPPRKRGRGRTEVGTRLSAMPPSPNI